MSSKTGIPLSQSKFFNRAKSGTSQRPVPSRGDGPEQPSPITPPIVGNLPVEESPRRVPAVTKPRTAQDLMNTLNKKETVSFLPKNKQRDTDRWYRDLVTYLRKMLAPISTEEELATLTSAKQQHRWLINFTHSSSNYNKGENYEIMEKLGDGVMRFAFINYLLQKYPELNESEISNLGAHYLSKPNQAPVAMRLGLNRFLIIEINIDTGVFEDLLEALFGTLFTIMSQEYDDKEAYQYTYRFLEYIYENIYPIDTMANKYGHPKSQVTQAFTGMRWGDLLEKKPDGNLRYVTVIENAAGVEVIIYFTDEAMRYFKNKKIDVSRILATGKGNTKKVASDMAYADALKRLTNLNKVNYIELSRQDKLINNPEVSAMYQQALQKAKAAGYQNIRVINLKSYRNKEALSLQGVDADDKNHLLIWAEGPNHIDVLKELFRGYLDS